MTAPITTAEQAARKAITWANYAENADKTAIARRDKGNELANTRGHQTLAADWYERAADWDQIRDKAVSMSNMWTNIARVLPADDGELS